MLTNTCNPLNTGSLPANTPAANWTGVRTNSSMSFTGNAYRMTLSRTNARTAMR